MLCGLLSREIALPIHYVYLFVSVVAEAVGYAALNASAQFTRLWPSLLVIGGFAGSFYFLTLALKYLPLGITYALASGLGIIVVSLAGVIVFGQRLDLGAVIGLGLIIAGMVVINAFSDFAVH
ncbi:MAG: QacE family quaternary ammonium compound efflux SMR transporter [Roseitalea sp.]|jgi:small multidrug resistance pump|nr:QacE family quaternary ammonium compound efflux SMR transporter [Roseitalea sp.]MBO6723926.1 QacE family quaternary ammonium compound efflux SMR transporter [Roseitalea sp.]MBO6745388.1 QacE family quaternary ammonium compound efflux SMR transporter [Roseitalea sp.]